ncbi:MAG: ATP-dependent helicase [Propionibacteriaceae bacterium]|jgi:DNA helicase-2/ATP-dependent DNA helicase PcrA|nr:ATP-dependent helicase [Propionibacteriaceae bacterium]
MLIDPDSVLLGLDERQKDVATTFGAPLAVLAGAGTGKTRAITHRIAYGVAVGEYLAPKVLAVTFTNKAAAELRGRLQQLGLPRVAARTFHSAALAQARFFWPQVYDAQLPQVRADRAALVEEGLARLGVKRDGALVQELDQEISWAKVNNVSPQDYAELAPKAGRDTTLDPDLMGKAYARYEQVKNGLGVIDFEDIELCCCALLAENPQVADEVRGTYRHLLVDEYQDVNPLQRTLLRLWLGAEPDITVVGDPAQTIHSFAGATSRYLEDFTDEFPSGQVLRLTDNYRSTPEIIAFANRVAKNNGVKALALRAKAAPGDEPRIISAPDELGEARAVAAWLDSLRPLPWSDMAVLYRTHAQAESFLAALKEKDIPCQLGVDRPTGTPAVTLTTLHASKGLEWEAVAVAGVSEGSIPYPTAQGQAQLEEEARLLYVGITRARSHLLLSWAERRNQRSARREVSRFLRGL